MPDDPPNAQVPRKLVVTSRLKPRIVEQLRDSVGSVGEVGETEEHAQVAHVVLAHAEREGF